MHSQQLAYPSYVCDCTTIPKLNELPHLLCVMSQAIEVMGTPYLQANKVGFHPMPQ